MQLEHTDEQPGVDQRSHLAESIDRAAEMIAYSDYAVAMTGAGMSVESGIHPFRRRRPLDPLRHPSDGRLQPVQGGPPRLLASGDEPRDRRTHPGIAGRAGHRKTARRSSGARQDGQGRRAEERNHAEHRRSRRTRRHHRPHRNPRKPQPTAVHGVQRKETARWFRVGRPPAPCGACGGPVKYDTVMFGSRCLKTR